MYNIHMLQLCLAFEIYLVSLFSTFSKGFAHLRSGFAESAPVGFILKDI